MTAGAVAAVATTLYIYDPNFRAAMDLMATSVVSGLGQLQRTEAKNRQKKNYRPIDIVNFKKKFLSEIRRQPQATEKIAI